MHTLTLSERLFTASYKLCPSTTEGTGGMQGTGGAGGGQNLGKSGSQLQGG